MIFESIIQKEMDAFEEELRGFSVFVGDHLEDGRAFSSRQRSKNGGDLSKLGLALNLSILIV